MPKNIVFLVIACLLCVSVNSARADLMLNSVDGYFFHDPVGGSNIEYPSATVAYGNTVQEQIRWGGNTTAANKSGLGFTGIADSTLVPVDEPFAIGQLVHFNQTIPSGTAADFVDLSITLTFETPEDFTFTFGINETNNAPGPPLSDDFIYFPGSLPSQTFVVDGQAYSLTLIGFGLTANSLEDYFRSPEGTFNEILLWGQISEVPVPGAVLLGILGLCVAGRKLRKFA